MSKCTCCSPCGGTPPVAQHQGEPVARVEIGADRNAALTITDENWLRSLKDHGAHQLVPLYANAGEVERLRSEVEQFKLANARLSKENVDRRAQLDDRDVLVKWWKDHLSVHLAILFGTCGHSPEEADQSADDIISRAERLAPKASASAEPSARGCCVPSAEEKALLATGEYTPQELWGGSRPTCPKCFKAEPK